LELQDKVFKQAGLWLIASTLVFAFIPSWERFTNVGSLDSAASFFIVQLGLWTMKTEKFNSVYGFDSECQFDPKQQHGLCSSISTARSQPPSTSLFDLWPSVSIF
jgi:hypothetical protein